jgi:hypothetical protein
MKDKDEIKKYIQIEKGKTKKNPAIIEPREGSVGELYIMDVSNYQLDDVIKF